MQSGTQGGLSGCWATFASDLDFARLPAELVAVLKCLVLDTLGVALAASTLGDCCRQVNNLVSANPGSPECTVLGFGTRASCLMGGFANGALAHALNFDALGASGGHIGLAAVPAPLAFAEREGAIDGRNFLAAIAVAAEFTARLAKSLKVANAETSEKFLEGQLLGYFGAALGAGRVLRFSPDRMHGALGLSLMQAAGTRQLSVEGAAAKAIYGGFANQGAILSVLLTEQGIEGRCAALEGPAGLFSLFYNGKYNASALMDGLGQKFVSEALSFKRWATSSVLGPFIKACLEARRQHRFDPSTIRQIRLHVAGRDLPWLEPAAERRHPRNAATAANSIFFGVAKALANGNVALSDFTTQGLVQRASSRLADLIEFTADEGQPAGSLVEIELEDGMVLPFVASEGSDDIRFEDLAVKFRDCANHCIRPIEPPICDQLIERIHHLEREKNVADLVALISGPAAR